jgi:hypothetical protein
MSNHNEEKKCYLPVDEKDSPLNYLTRSNLWYGGYPRAWKRVSDRAYRYALYNAVNDEWFRNRLNGSTHDALGIALRVFEINISKGYVNRSIDLLKHQWNTLLNMYNNALVRKLLTLVVARGRESIKDLFDRGFSAESMCDVIKDALTLLFDAQNPDASSPSELLVVLRDPNRDDIHHGGAHACFSVAANDTNVCWRSRTQHDDYLCHFFGTALHHALAFLKYYMSHQKYYISENMEMEEFKIEDMYCIKVVIAFGIDAYPVDHEESSDEDDEEEEPDDDNVDCGDPPQIEVIPGVYCEIDKTPSVTSSVEDELTNTLMFTYAADGTSTMHQPDGFTRITQVVERGRHLTQSQQVELLVENVIPLLELRQLERLLVDLPGYVSDIRAREAVIVPAVSVPQRNFFNTTSFSSDSEGDEGN